MIEICLCADDRYMMPAGVCITSIFENNKDEKVRVHLITEGISKENEKKLRKTAERYQQQVEIHRVDAEIFNDFPTTSQFSKAIYLRYLIPQILDENIEKALYLDCDIICDASLKKLWASDLGDNYCGVCLDPHGDDIVIRNRLNAHQEHLTSEDVYFNSGVLLFDVRKWREENLAHQLITFVDQNKDICNVYPDQDALNCLFVGKVKFLPLRYNVQEACLLKKKYLHLRDDLYSTIYEAVKNPCFIHFSSKMKPWMPFCSHPWAYKFDIYRNMSLWPLTFAERFSKVFQKIRKTIHHLRFPNAISAYDIHNHPRL